MNTTTKILLGFGAIAVVAALVFAMRPGDPAPIAGGDPPVGDEPTEVQPGAQTKNQKDDKSVVGGVRRPDTDVSDQSKADETAKQDKDDDSEADYGKTPAVPVDANPQVAAVAKAKRDGDRPELFSPAIKSKKFDLVSYQQYPQAYLDSPEPGRVFQPAQPGPDVPVIRRKSDYRLPVVQGEVVRLQVQATEDAPVSFTSFDLGQFSNQLTTVTVAADEQGIATAEFLATPGTINKINILAASPVTSGQVKFVVHVSLPEK